MHQYSSSVDARMKDVMEPCTVTCITHYLHDFLQGLNRVASISFEILDTPNCLHSTLLPEYVEVDYPLATF